VIRVCHNLNSRLYAIILLLFYRAKLDAKLIFKGVEMIKPKENSESYPLLSMQYLDRNQMLIPAQAWRKLAEEFNSTLTVNRKSIFRLIWIPANNTTHNRWENRTRLQTQKWLRSTQTFPA